MKVYDRTDGVLWWISSKDHCDYIDCRTAPSLFPTPCWMFTNMGMRFFCRTHNLDHYNFTEKHLPLLKTFRLYQKFPNIHNTPLGVFSIELGAVDLQDIVRTTTSSSTSITFLTSWKRQSGHVFEWISGLWRDFKLILSLLDALLWILSIDNNFG